MKLIKICLICLLFFNCHSSTTLVQHTSQDTFFLKKWDTVYDGYHSFQKIYIEKNRSAKEYKDISDFNFSASVDMNWYFEQFRVKGLKITKKDTRQLPNDWVALYAYKQKYYVYNACDGNWIWRGIVNDSSVVFWGHEPIPYVLNSIIKQDDSTFSIRLNGTLPGEEKYREPDVLTIYIIDQKNKIAVWEYKPKGERTFRYELCIPKENVPNFDLVVNYTSARFEEFEFDKIDFEKLLKNRKRP